jgi:hypothetical protein
MDKITQKFQEAAAEKNAWRRAEKFKEARALLQQQSCEVSAPDASDEAKCRILNCGPSFLRQLASWLPKSKISRPARTYSHKDVRVELGNVKSARMGNGEVKIEPPPRASMFDSTFPDLDGSTPEKTLLGLLATIPKSTADLWLRTKNSICSKIEALRAFSRGNPLQ